MSISRVNSHKNVTGVSIDLNGGEGYGSSNFRSTEKEDMCNRIMGLGARSEIKDLPIGDAILLAHLQDGTELLLYFVIECVSVSDVLWISYVHNCIIFHSVYRKFHESAENIFVLEGDHSAATPRFLSDESTEMSMESVFFELKQYNSCVIEHTKSAQETAILYHNIQQKVSARLSGIVSPLEIGCNALTFFEWSRKMNE